jgi:hypothetical protein
MSTITAHIILDERGVAWIDDTNMKVIEVVLDKLAHGWSPEEIHFQHPLYPWLRFTLHSPIIMTISRHLMQR